VELERSKQWFAFAKFFLGTFAVGIVTLIANHQIQERELEIKEQESVGHFLEQALTQDVGVRRRFAQYFATVTRSDKLRTRWESYLTVVDREYDDTRDQLRKAEQDVQKAIDTPGTDDKLSSVKLDQYVSKVEELRSALAVKPTATREKSIVPRVYFHIRSEEQRDKAKQLGDELSSALSVAVPGVQRVTSGPEKNELRYFDSANVEEARSIATVLSQESGLTVQPVLLSGYEGLVRPRHYELWLSKDAFAH